MKMKFRNYILFLVFIAPFFTSCVSINKLKYVRNDLPDSEINTYINNRSEKTIKPYDYLYIQVYSLDEKTNNIFNPRVYGTSDPQLMSYTVSDSGSINFPFIGEIFVKDMTIDQAKNKIESSLSRYLNNISVRVRFVGNKITVLGEVKNPGSQSFYDEKINVFQAISLASGITNFGNKTDVTLIRESNDKITYHYLDLSDKNIVSSKYYYLLPNDILIVSPQGQNIAH